MDNVVEMKTSKEQREELKKAVNEIMPDSDSEKLDLLKLTPEEQNTASEYSGMRGQIKKILRVLRDDFNREHEIMKNSISDFQKSVVGKIEKLDKGYRSLYGGMMREVLIPIEGRLVIVDTGFAALRDYVADKLFVTYQSHHQFAGELIELRNAIKSIQTDIEILKGDKPVDRIHEVHPEMNQTKEEYIKGFRSDVEVIRGRIEKDLRERAKKQQEEVASGNKANSDIKNQGEEIQNGEEKSSKKEDIEEKTVEKDSEIKLQGQI